MAIHLGILLALLSALAANLASLFKHRGACQAPDVSLRHPVRSAAGLFRSGWFATGMLVALGAWILHVGALALAPLSLVHVIASGGLVFLTVLADRHFGHAIRTRQRAGVTLAAVGLTLLMVTVPADGGAPSGHSAAGMIAFQAGLLAVGSALALSQGLVPRQRRGVVLGIAAGTLLGVSEVALEALTGAVAQVGLRGLLSPWMLTCAIAAVIAFYAFARGLQTGEAVPVIALMSLTSNISSIGGGIVVFGDPLPSHPIGIAAQVTAFILILVAATLIPPAVRPAPAPAV